MAELSVRKEDNVTIDVGIASLCVAIIAAGIAVWQGIMARRNLRLAEGAQAKAEDAMTRTQQKVEDALAEIRDLSKDTKLKVEDIKSEIDDRITRILDARIEHDRNNQVAGNEFMKLLFGMSQQSSHGLAGPQVDSDDGDAAPDARVA